MKITQFSFAGTQQNVHQFLFANPLPISIPFLPKYVLRTKQRGGVTEGK